MFGHKWRLQTLNFGLWTLDVRLWTSKCWLATCTVSDHPYKCFTRVENSEIRASMYSAIKPNKKLIFLRKKAKNRPIMISNSKKWNNFLNIFLKNSSFLWNFYWKLASKTTASRLIWKIGAIFSQILYKNMS